MELGEAVSTCLSKYATISGRARRSEFWWWVLATWLVGLGVGLLEAVLGIGSPDGGGPLSGLYALAILLPNICVAGRRLHDTDRSAWWLLIVLVPVIGFLVLIYFYIQRGTTGENRFGPDPLAAAAAPQ
ncbi:DUF805 domain-containing protein [Pikeienuella piscinae]|uniref:DUF805 domain-containing protein n=1 Tax=Pikeienuella piscinae TaxID=2748098 RepID=A0A7L5C0R4_9RHOB|nr:DUF805 domain-containing protein [Pikeienuella piscinae]QIE56106.1 DUF805 domain-containing protein [Pikeienuella piscinae]